MKKNNAKLTRREFFGDSIKYSGLLLSQGLLSKKLIASSKSSAKIIVVGGGFGGATCANYLKSLAPGLDVTLIEPNPFYFTCPFSNTVISGINPISFIKKSYDGLKLKNINHVQDSVESIDFKHRTIVLRSKSKLNYDALVLSPGIDFNSDTIEGYKQNTSEHFPHAWKAGAQTVLLRKQIESMSNGGNIVIAIPEKPYRAPPAPYERASLLAYYCKMKKPASKILIIDPNKAFYKQALFEQSWKKLYPNHIERIVGMSVSKVDIGNNTVITNMGDKIKGAVINLIPQQRAGLLASKHGLVDDSTWCPVDSKTFQARNFADLYIIGDACKAGDMPKSAFAASSQAKVCAAAIVAKIYQIEIPDMILNSSFYSLISPKYAISSSGIYRVINSEITKTSGGTSKLKANKRIRYKEARFAKGWYSAITQEAFAI